MGVAKRRQVAVQTQSSDEMVVDTPGARIQLQWDHGASATPNAQLAFFGEFLATTGIDDSWVNRCPLIYTSPNAHRKLDVLGTRLLAILAGHKRYSHITGLRGDTLSAETLGMQKMISEDALRRSLSRTNAEQSQRWLAPQLLGSVQAALNTPWILDIDTTIKPCMTPGPGDQGWSAVEDTLKLASREKSRRVVVLRRGVKADLALRRKIKNAVGEQIELLMPAQDVEVWEYAVLVTNSTCALDAFGQLYRDRADCENDFDELKNQWGWGGFTTQDIERCQTSARAIALVYNW